jgi:CBS domain-containing protein
VNEVPCPGAVVSRNHVVGAPPLAARCSCQPPGQVLTTSAARSVAEVTSRMVKARVGSAVVMEGSWLAGILTERDVLRAAASGSDLTKAPVSQWMTRNR